MHSTQYLICYIFMYNYYLGMRSLACEVWFDGDVHVCSRESQKRSSLETW